MWYASLDQFKKAQQHWAPLCKTLQHTWERPPLAQILGSTVLQAGWEWWYELLKHHPKPAFDLTPQSVNGHVLGVHETLSCTTPFAQLRSFVPVSDHAPLLNAARRHPQVMVVAPLSGHHATLLRDTVQAMVFDVKVSISDWTDARQIHLEHGVFSLTTYLDVLNAMWDKVEQDALQSGVPWHVVAVCQGTVPALALACYRHHTGRSLPASLTLMGGPVDPRCSPTQVNRLATERSLEWFERTVIDRVPAGYPGEGRRVYPGFLQHFGFVAMNPQHHWKAHRDFFNHLVEGDHDSAARHRKFYNEYNAVLDMDAAYYLETIRWVFQEFRLPQEQWVHRGVRLRPSQLTGTRLLAIEGENDDISGVGQTKAALNLCSALPSSEKRYELIPKVGHYGVFSGKVWRSTIWPLIQEFQACN